MFLDYVLGIQDSGCPTEMSHVIFQFYTTVSQVAPACGTVGGAAFSDWRLGCVYWITRGGNLNLKNIFIESGYRAFSQLLINRGLID